MTGKTARTTSLADFTACDGVPSVNRKPTMADRAREIVAGFIDGGDACAVCELSDRRELDRWRGVELFDRSIPAHYRGDGYVTCSRAMESASAQGTVVPRSAMGMWWWMCAFKYVWRMWSKADPIADAMKALSCLEHIKDSLEEDLDER